MSLHSDQSALPKHSPTPSVLKPDSELSKVNETSSSKAKWAAAAILGAIVVASVGLVIDLALCTYKATPRTADVFFEGDSIVARTNMGLESTSYLSSYRVRTAVEYIF